MIRIALIGCGHHGRDCHGVPLARFAKRYPERLELTAACDMDRARADAACRDYGFHRAYTDIDQMLQAEKLDACHCIVQPSFVPDVVAHMFERKMPCVVEKPLGVDRAGLNQLVQAAKNTSVPHMVSVNRRFMPILNRALAWAREHGPIEFIRGALMRDNRTEGCFGFSTGIHSVDAFRYCMGDVASFNYQVQTGNSLARDWQHINFRFTSGAFGRLDLLPSAGLEEECYEFFGQNYYVRTVSTMHRGALMHCYQSNELVHSESCVNQPGDVYRGDYAEVEELVDALENRRPMKPTILDVAPSVEICLAIAEESHLPTAM